MYESGGGIAANNSRNGALRAAPCNGFGGL